MLYMLRGQKLYLFTATFPYGKAESFLEDEILFLSKEFKKIVIIPLSGSSSQRREVPYNCIVVAPVINSKSKQYSRGLFCFKSVKLYSNDFIEKKVFLSVKRLKEWFVSMVLTNNLLKSKTVNKVFDNITKDDVCYFYWGKGSNLLSYFYKGKAKFVSRFHGEWDLWEESGGNYAPCRRQLADSLNFAVFISKKGESYFKSKYPNCNTVVYPLGSLDYGCCNEEKKENTLRVVSCSTVYPLKRVPLIFDALNSLSSYRIEWTHIGGGVDFEALRKKVEEEKKSHLTITLLGNMKHDEVMAYYKEHQFDVFVNLSTNEGVPVSIMEAISFNIPIIATEVGGTSEVVTAETGLLVGPNPSLDEVASAIVRLTGLKLNPRDFWQKNYSAQNNYTSFAHFLKSL